MYNNSLKDTFRIPVIGKWITDEGAEVSGALAITPESDLVFSVDGTVIEEKNDTQYVRTKYYTTKTAGHEQITIGWFSEGNHGVGINHLAVYPDYAIVGEEFVKEGLFDFKTVVISFGAIFWEHIESRYQDGDLLVKVKDKDGPSIFKTKDYEIKIGKGYSEETRMSPPRFIIKGGRISATVTKKQGNFNNINEILMIGVRIKEYLTILNGTEVTIAGIDIADEETYRYARFIAPSLFVEKNKQERHLRGVGIEHLFEVAESTFVNFFDNYLDVAALVAGHAQYISGLDEQISMDLQIGRLLQSIDMVTKSYYDQLNADPDSEESMKKKEYKAALELIKPVIRETSDDLKKFVSSAGRFYANPSFGARLKKLAQDYDSIVHTRYANGDYSDVLNDLRNDIMHGRGIDYIKYSNSVIDYGQGLNALEALVLCYLFKKFGLSEDLLKTITGWNRP